MSYIEGQNREQMSLFPDAIDQYITPENPVRVMDAFVDSLSLDELGFTKATPKETGRPPYHPGDLLKLYLYGYLNRIRSSRQLEQESQRNLEVMWLLKRLTPDFKTIADFRKDNGAAIRQCNRAFVLLCREAGLYGREMIAIDGSQFKAVNSRERHFTRRKLEARLKDIDDKINDYLVQLAHNDAQETVAAVPAGQVQAMLEKLKAKQTRYAALARQMDETQTDQVSLTDPDARYLTKRHSGHSVIGYNVQTVVDGKHKLIVDYDVTQDANDKNQLAPMTQQAQALLDKRELTVLADTGYYHGEQIREVTESGALPYVSSLNTSSNRARGLYGKEQFRYLQDRDAYQCPAGELLVYRYSSKSKGKQLKHYETAACITCLQRPQCTWRKKGPRRISRWEHEDLLDDMERRKQAHPEILSQRKSIVEHPFGTIKRTMNQGYFLMKRLKNVKTEMGLTVLAYNMKRAINIMGTKKLIEMIT